MAPAVAVPMLPALSLLDPLGALLVGCGVLESAFIGTALAFVVHYREHGLLRATSVDLTLLTVLATGLTSLPKLTEVLVPVSVWWCCVRYFCMQFGAALVYLALLLKLMRIARVLVASRKGRDHASVLCISSLSVLGQFLFGAFLLIGLFAGMAFVYGWPLLFPPSRLNYSFHAQSATPFIPGVDLTTIPFYSSSHLLVEQKNLKDVSHILPPERDSTLIDFTNIEPTLSSHRIPPTAVSGAPTKSMKPTTHPTTAVSPVPLAHMCFLRHAAQYVVPNIIQLVLAVALVVGSLHLRHLPDNFRETRIIFVLALVQLVLSSLFAPVYFLARTVDTVIACWAVLSCIHCAFTLGAIAGTKAYAVIILRRPSRLGPIRFVKRLQHSQLSSLAGSAHNSGSTIPPVLPLVPLAQPSRDVRGFGEAGSNPECVHECVSDFQQVCREPKELQEVESYRHSYVQIQRV